MPGDVVLAPAVRLQGADDLLPLVAGGLFRPGRLDHGPVQRGGEELPFDAAGGAGDVGVLDGIFQFADVSRPVVGHQQGHRPAGDLGDALAAGVELLDEGLRQQGDVLLALAQRRQVDGDDAEPVVEVLAEIPLVDLPAQVLVGGGDDAHVGLAGLDAADALELPLLQHPQQLRL
ncbi:MAG TPA: hypothetical protein VD811_04180, partial [Desulfuromonadales bacterium]|nr:hypothetical protein [Desulfuromonadales bacterium]